METTDCDVIISSTNHDWVLNGNFGSLYCKDKYCCLMDYWSTKDLNKCDENFCCSKWRKCVNYRNPKSNLPDGYSTERVSRANIVLLCFGSIVVICLLISIIFSVRSLYKDCTRTTNQNVEQGTNNQSDTSLQPLPSYSQLYFENTNICFFQLRNNSPSDIQISDSDIQIPDPDIQISDPDIQRSDSDIQRSDSDIQIPDSDIQNDEDILPSYEESLNLPPFSVAPPSYTEE